MQSSGKGHLFFTAWGKSFILRPVQQPYKNINYFGGLNALRFFAAFLVLLQHGATIGAKNNFANLTSYSLFRNGHNAVLFFFVLSGFLITYLLLKEIDRSDNVNIKTFYLKRVYRIWPLYYLLLLLGLLVLPLVNQLLHLPYQLPYSPADVWPYFVFFVPGLVTHFYGHHFLEPLWSIGVEEVFYLVWAPLVSLCKRKVLWLLYGVIAIKLFLLFLVQLHIIRHATIVYLIELHSFSAMAIGGLGAYWLMQLKQPIENLTVFKKPFRVVLYSLILLYLLADKHITILAWSAVFHHTFFSEILLCLLYLYVILSVSVVHKAGLLQHKSLNFLGEISFGIYMYHVLVINLLIQIFKKLGMPQNLFCLLLFFVLATVITIGIAAFSKKYFEDWFLKFNKRH